MSLVEAYEDSHVWQWYHQEGNKRDSRQAFDPASNEEIESAYRTGEAACAYNPDKAIDLGKLVPLVDVSFAFFINEV